MSEKRQKPEEQPEVYAVKQEKSSWQFSRREFLAVTSVAAVTALSAGCGTSAKMGRVCGNTKAHLNEIHRVIISPDNSMLLSDTIGTGDLVKLWSLPEGRLVKTFPTGFTRYDHLFSSNGSMLAYYSKDAKDIQLVSLTDDERFNTLQEHTHYVDALAFCPDGTLLASAGFDETIRLWSLPEGELQKTIDVECDIIQELVISPDSRLLAAKVDGNRILLYSLPQGNLLGALEGHQAQIYNTLILFSPDMTMLATGSDDETVKLWSLPDGKLLQTLDGFEKMVYMAYTPDSKVLVAGNGGGMLGLWSLPDGKLIKTLTEGNFGGHMAISTDGALLAAGISGGNSYGVFTLWSLPGGEELLTSDKCDDGTFEDLIFSLDGTMMITKGYSDDVIRLWSVSTGKLSKTLKGHQDSISAISLSQDGALLVTGDQDGSIKLWSMPDGDLVACPVDLKSMSVDSKGITIETTDDNGNPTSYDLPCGSPLPAGAVCTCNCVSGTYSCSCVGHSAHYWHPD